MTSVRRYLFLIFLFIIASFSFAMAESKWITYHGDFASFLVRWDYNLDFKKGGGTFTYIIEDPKYPNNKLIIHYYSMSMDFKLPKKYGYKVQFTGPIKTKNTRGVEYRGIDKEGKHWREVYLYYSTRGPMGPDTRLLHIYYEKAEGPLSVNFNKIIESINVNDPLKVKINPNFPTMNNPFQNQYK